MSTSDKHSEDNYVSAGSTGGKIRRIRELRGYTRRELGLRCGYSASSSDGRIAQYERGEKLPRKKAAKELTDALNVDEGVITVDPDLASLHHMYHALFDIEDFHGLHPVKIDGTYYLEFGGPTMSGKDVSRYDYEEFLDCWALQYQKYVISDTASEEEIRQLRKAYDLWRFEYPQNVNAEEEKRRRKQSEIRRLKAQLDAAHAELMGDDELAELDGIMRDVVPAVRETYADITLESEFILLIERMMEEGAQMRTYFTEKLPIDLMYLIAFRTSDLKKAGTIQTLYAEFLCQLDTMRRGGLKIERSIHSKDEELYITYMVSSDHYSCLSNLDRVWDDMVFLARIADEKGHGRYDDFMDGLLEKITGDNDHLLVPPDESELM